MFLTPATIVSISNIFKDKSMRKGLKITKAQNMDSFDAMKPGYGSINTPLPRKKFETQDLTMELEDDRLRFINDNIKDFEDVILNFDETIEIDPNINRTLVNSYMFLNVMPKFFSKTGCNFFIDVNYMVFKYGNRELRIAFLVFLNGRYRRNS